ncbi:Acetyltransferase, GNAT family [Aphelenchoides bicaudatus]|nr:Acetyltransferase, GNAT family [Aphelenchoides bicaudatus]
MFVFKSNCLAKMESVRKYELPKIKRTCIAEDFPLKTLERSIRIEVAEEQDQETIEHFLNTDFVGNEPMNASIDLTVEEFAVFIKPTLDESLKQRVSLLAVDDGCLCGLFINNIHKANHTGKWKEPVMKEDYGDEFDADQTPSENFKKIAVMLGEVETFIAQNLPADVNEYLRLDVLSVHKDYTKNGLAKKLTVESCKHAQKKGIKWAQITGSSVATNKIAQSMGFKQIFSLELNKFKAHGEQVFPDEFFDGGKQIGCYVIELKSLV